MEYNKKAEEMLKSLTEKERVDGDVVKKIQVLTDKAIDSKDDPTKQLIHDLQDEMDMEDSYRWASEALEFIADQEDDAMENDITENARYYEASDIYNTDLTGWLHGDLCRIGEVDDAISEMGMTSIIDAIQYAQQWRFEKAVYAIIIKIDKIEQSQ